jgi:hypothetical protein
VWSLDFGFRLAHERAVAIRSVSVSRAGVEHFSAD